MNVRRGSWETRGRVSLLHVGKNTRKMESVSSLRSLAVHHEMHVGRLTTVINKGKELIMRKILLIVWVWLSLVFFPP